MTKIKFYRKQQFKFKCLNTYFESSKLNIDKKDHDLPHPIQNPHPENKKNEAPNKLPEIQQMSKDL